MITRPSVCVKLWSADEVSTSEKGACMEMAKQLGSLLELVGRLGSEPRSLADAAT
jgi:hypothetical protein